MLLSSLLSWLVISPLLIEALSIQPRVGDVLQQDEGICLAYNTCSEKGLGYWNKLHTTLYQSQQGQIIDPTSDRQEIRPSDSNGHWKIFGFDPISQQRDQTSACYNIFDTHNGLIIAESNRRGGDSQQKLPWSELMYQTWSYAAKNADSLAAANAAHPPGGPISNLRAVVQHFIVNKGTQQVLTAAYNARGWVPGYDGEDQWREFKEEDAGKKNFFFYSLLGTDNVKGTVWLLNDHANEIGRKDISAIHVRWHMGNPDIW
ncbi:MAG: hypothetical protein Q9198_001195 [Flavoplaca austrocitrina]